jgi:hypothetical protein
MDSIEFRLQLAQTRSYLQEKGFLKPVKAMIEKGFWARTKQDNNYLSGRIINKDFLEALKKLNNNPE